MTAVKAVDKSAKKAPAKAAKKVSPVARAAKNAPVAHGVGRRKASVARVWLRRNGQGLITVNDRNYNDYFNTVETRKSVQLPITIVPGANTYDIEVNVVGGGTTGQAEAIRLALSRALVIADEQSRPLLKEQGLLTVDSRIVERKKPGQSGARRKFQFVKR